MTKKSFVSVPGFAGEDAVLGPAGIRTEYAQAADENGHLGRRQRQQLRPIHQRFFRRHELGFAAEIVAEAVGAWLERGKRVHVGLILRRVHASRREGNLHVDPGILRGFLDCRAPPRTIRSASETFLPPDCEALNSFWIASSF